MKKILSILKDHLGLVAVLIIIAGLLSYKVVTQPSPFFDWDESIYIQVGKEMVKNVSIVPLYKGEPWLEKPFLAPLLYGIIQLLPLNPEITTRLFAVFLSMIALALWYTWVYSIQKSKAFALMVTVITILNPIFLQRAQIVNTDVFLIIGWLGYLLFYKRFWPSLLFLSIGVLSKSLLGFYPVFIIFIYDIYTAFIKKDRRFLLTRIKFLAAQCGILSIWYILNLIAFKETFIQVHFADHLVKRVTKSIEAHFGHRTFYLDIIYIQYGKYAFIPFLSVLILSYQFFKKHITAYQYLLALALVPWFIFLNITRTKIFWYVYPAIPGIILLILYPVSLLKRFKYIFLIVSIVITGLYIRNNFQYQYQTTYSSYDATYKMSTTAKNECSSLDILVEETARKDHQVLKEFDLLISTSDIYGTNPSIIYYFEKPVRIFYESDAFNKQLTQSPKGSCATINQKDQEIIDSSLYKKTHQFEHLYLYKRV